MELENDVNDSTDGNNAISRMSDQCLFQLSSWTKENLLSTLMTGKKRENAFEIFSLSKSSNLWSMRSSNIMEFLKRAMATVTNGPESH